ncbi:hypothetical protein [Vibrio crassostreae]|uniref:hypothetical protein n=1 Tax=Vibrio crassostreae TaxID=246167 RepID=UPI001B311B57|nr:hypothetical protein [Vibrio crassostreae]
MPLRKDKLVDVSIHGGDFIASLALAKLMTDKGYTVALFSHDYGYFNYSKFFTTEMGRDALKCIGLKVGGGKTLEEFALSLASTINPDNISYYGENYRLKDMSNKQSSFIDVSLSNLKPSTDLDEAIYRTIGKPDSSFLKYLPRLVKNQRVQTRCVVLTTPVSLINGLQVRRFDTFNRFYSSRRDTVLTHSASFQTTDFRESEQMSTEIRKYLDELKSLPEKIECFVAGGR